MINSAPWWTLNFLPGAIILLNFVIFVLLLGGFVFLLVKVASIDRTLKEVLQKLNDRL